MTRESTHPSRATVTCKVVKRRARTCRATQSCGGTAICLALSLIAPAWTQRAEPPFPEGARSGSVERDHAKACADRHSATAAVPSIATTTNQAGIRSSPTYPRTCAHDPSTTSFCYSIGGARVVRLRHQMHVGFLTQAQDVALRARPTSASLVPTSCTPGNVQV